MSDAERIAGELRALALLADKIAYWKEVLRKRERR